MHVAPSFAMGGRELRVIELIGMMPRTAGVRHVVCALDDRRDTLERLPDGACDIVELPAPDTSGRGLWARLRQCRAVLEERRPELLLTYNWGSVEWLLAVRIFGLDVRVVHHEDGFGPDEAARLLRRRNWLRRLAFTICDAVVVPSRTLEAIAQQHWKQPAERLLYLPNGVDLARFSPGGMPKASSRESDDVVFGCVGRIRPEKNQRLAVQALARMIDRSARLNIVGDGTELDDVRSLATELGVADRVRFVGAVRDTAPEYHEFDVFLIPLQDRADAPQPLGGDGLCSAGRRHGRRRCRGDGRAREPRVDRPVSRSREALAAKMDELTGDRTLRRSLGAANRLKVESEFEREACFGAYVALYGQLVGRDLAAPEGSPAQSP